MYKKLKNIDKHGEMFFTCQPETFLIYCLLQIGFYRPDIQKVEHVLNECMEYSSKLLRPLSMLVCALPANYLFHLRPTLSRLVDYLAESPPPAQQVRYNITRHCQTYGINLRPHAEVSAYVVHGRTKTLPLVQQSTSPPPQHPCSKGSGGLSMSLQHNKLDSHNVIDNNCTSFRREDDLHQAGHYRGNQLNNSWREENTQMPQFHVVRKKGVGGETALLQQNLFKMVHDIVNKSSSDDTKLQEIDNEQLMNPKYQSEFQNSQSQDTKILELSNPVDPNETKNVKEVKSACALSPERFRNMSKKFETSVPIKPHQPQLMNQEYHNDTAKLPAPQKLQSKERQSDYQARFVSQVSQVQLPVSEISSSVGVTVECVNSHDTQLSGFKRKEDFPAFPRKSELSNPVFEAENNVKDEDKALVMPLELLSFKASVFPPAPERTVEEENQALVIPLELPSYKVSGTEKSTIFKGDSCAVDHVLKKKSYLINLKRSQPYSEAKETYGASSKHPRLSAASNFDKKLQISYCNVASTSKERTMKVSPKWTRLSRKDDIISIENNENTRMRGTSQLQQLTSSQVEPSLTKRSRVNPHIKTSSEDRQGNIY